ncbi:SDH family Clp fold serine proteinase [Variovorax guangxiensis]|uniref:Serine dehydrogenasease n=1 Tax=Variovorax guangxiensis TaxID=1775474 RepID=A0A840FWF5_9BURK|nr:hypothetical protein [Variovorax guangxiensis]MBB4223447.1 hypothetical protein [Variovorax guangxiensis]
MAESFPRSTDLPTQSPLFWVAHKDRYLRQLLIRDIEALTKRKLLVYFSDCNVQGVEIDGGDDVFLAELLGSCPGEPVDLMIETNGGQTDATEKLCSLLRSGPSDLRVVVPRRAKSNGTVLALTGRSILMGNESELGPIDPSINGIPVEFILAAPQGSFGPLDIQVATRFRDQTQKLAYGLLSSGMLAGKDEAFIRGIIAKIATRDHYHSHGSVIDASEAFNLGLSVENLPPTDELWKRMSLLRAMYQHDCTQQGFTKIFEGSRISLVVAPKPVAPPLPSP